MRNLGLAPIMEARRVLQNPNNWPYLLEAHWVLQIQRYFLPKNQEVSHGLRLLVLLIFVYRWKTRLFHFGSMYIYINPKTHLSEEALWSSYLECIPMLSTVLHFISAHSQLDPLALLHGPVKHRCFGHRNELSSELCQRYENHYIHQITLIWILC